MTMNMTLTFTVPNGTPIEITLVEAKELYLELSKLFGEKK